MTLRSRLFLASALVLGAIGLQAGAASAEPSLSIDTQLAAPGDARIEKAGVYCTWAGCVRAGGYGYGYRPYAYNYGYRPYGYRVVIPTVRYGYY